MGGGFWSDYFSFIFMYSLSSHSELTLPLSSLYSQKLWSKGSYLSCGIGKQPLDDRLGIFQFSRVQSKFH